MSENKDRTTRISDQMQDINSGLTSLLGALGDTLNQVVQTAESLSDQEVAREHVIQTPNGPIKARAGVHIRMGGLAGQTSTDRDPAEPVKAAKPKPKDETRAPLVDIYENAGEWMLTAEMPGVALDDVSLRIEGQTLHVETSGSRKYATEVAAPVGLTVDQLEISLTNGILELRRPAGPEG
ncbi:MAG: Hsp20/alpha crystallin family protein [Pseudomonadota bacterium]